VLKWKKQTEIIKSLLTKQNSQLEDYLEALKKLILLNYKERMSINV